MNALSALRQRIQRSFTLPREPDGDDLKKIGRDIHAWHLGAFPPGVQIFWAVWLLPTVAGFLITTSVSLPSSVLALVFLCISGLALFVACFVTSGLPKTWEDTLDARLAKYQAYNQDAWHYLQGTVQAKGVLELCDVECWYRREIATVYPQRKKTLHFLETSSDSAAPTGTGQG